MTATLGTTFVGGSAQADPKQLTAAVGVGSDTTQDVMNAMTGFTNGINYTPIQSSSASGYRQVISFDALPPAGVADACITPKVGGPTFARPQGSSAGRKALSRAQDGTKYGNAACGGVQDVAGLVDFARSSAGPSTGDVGTALTYVPFGRDGMSFAYYRAAGSPVTSLTRAQLTTLFTTGVQTINGVRILPCGIQTNSGTYAFWQLVTTATATQENTATTECNALLAAGRAEENAGDQLKARGDAAEVAVPGTQVVIGFSAGSFISKANLVAPGAPPAGVVMGSIDDGATPAVITSPVVGTAPNLTPNATFFASSIYGRNVYNVFPTAVIASAFGNDDLKSLFVGSTSAICSASVTTEKFGFLSLGSNCGTTTTKGSLIAGQL
jgi:hypothetical protein